MSERALSVNGTASAVVEEIAAGLSLSQKELPAKFFYDTRGSELFEEITALPEYYLTRCEQALLERLMPTWFAEDPPGSLVELGAGSAVKTEVVLRAMLDAGGSSACYVPVDVSAEFLEATAERIRVVFPKLEVTPLVADMTLPFALPCHLPPPTLHAFLGSTIGNFGPEQASALLTRVRERMRSGDRFLMGVDLRKEPARLEAAYNDAAGVTAEFNLNLLRVVNMETGADFDPTKFHHSAFYDEVEHRIEMHLVARVAHSVQIPGAGEFDLAEGESIRTEISCKHDRGSVDRMFASAGLVVERWATDAEALYALVLGAPAG